MGLRVRVRVGVSVGLADGGGALQLLEGGGEAVGLSGALKLKHRVVAEGDLVRG